MYFLQKHYSPYHQVQLFQPSFAYSLTSPREELKCATNKHSSSPGAFSSSYMHVIEEDERSLLYTDLPGVKAEDLKVELTEEGTIRIHGEKKKKGQSIEFERQFTVDDQNIDISKITATMSDGSLTLVFPKKEVSKPRSVPVVAGHAPEDESALNFELDLPGVKVEKVEVSGDGKLDILGKRKRGGETFPISKAIRLDRNAVDIQKIGVFLEDGVFTIRAPKKEPFEARSIPVSSSSEDEQEEDHDTQTPADNGGSSNDASTKEKNSTDPSAKLSSE